MPANLLVDIGGTYTRCALLLEDGERPESVEVLKNEDWADPVLLLKHYLERVEQATSALIAVAGPVTEGSAQLTNLDWRFEEAALAAALELDAVHLINDFAAMALSIPSLEPDETLRIGGGEAQSDAPIALLGPGTGLGVSGLIPSPSGWVPLRSEGGHVTLPAAREHEARIIERMREQFDHVSAERVLSGPGLVALYQTVKTGSPASGETIKPKEVSQLALAGDPTAEEALSLFFSMLGTVAGDIALTLGARGGVYLGGGMLPRLKSELIRSRFRQQFEDKGRFRGYLESIPVFLIEAATPTLLGLVALRRPSPGGYNL